MKRVHIDRLDIRLRNVPAETAQDAGRLLGPALARALQQRTVAGTGGADVDAGRVSVGDTRAEALAASIAQRIAATTSRTGRE